MYGEFLINAQGEDVVAGIRTPLHIGEMQKIMPESHRQIKDVYERLEKHFREMQDVEFTIEEGKLYMLQCRTGKRSPAAAFQIALDHATKPLLTTVTIRIFSTDGRISDFFPAAARRPAYRMAP